MDWREERLESERTQVVTGIAARVFQSGRVHPRQNDPEERILKLSVEI